MSGTLDIQIMQRLTTLEVELRRTKEEIADLKTENAEMRKHLSYYDKMAVKWGSACMGAIAFGAIVSGHFDKLKDKLIAWFLS